jgi:signal transduction histidine kinase
MVQEHRRGQRSTIDADDYQAVLDFIDKMEKLSHFQDKIDIRSDIDLIWQAIREDLAHLVAVDASALFLVNTRTRAFELHSSEPESEKERFGQELDFQVQCGMFSWVINRRQPALIPSLVFKKKKSIIMLPLATAKRTLGAVMVLTKISEQTITQEEMKLLGLLTRQSSLTMENTLLYDRLKQEHADLQQARNQILQSEKFASIGRITSGAFHEILNPLNIVSGHIQFALMRDDLDDGLRRYLHIMQEQSDRIARIVKGLLQFSHYPKQKLEEIDLNRLIDNVLQTLEHEFSFEQIEIEKRYDNGLPHLNGSVENLSKAFSHLFDNARLAMQGGGRMTIQTGLEAPAPDDRDARPALRIIISDNGEGVAAGNADKIFEPFFTTWKTHSGLGLPTAYSIVHDHGGDLFLGEQDGPGASFVVLLPLP